MHDAEGALNLVGIIVNIFFGFKANSWRERNLISRGYDLLDTVSANNKEGATALALKNIN